MPKREFHTARLESRRDFSKRHDYKSQIFNPGPPPGPVKNQININGARREAICVPGAAELFFDQAKRADELRAREIRLDFYGEVPEFSFSLRALRLAEPEANRAHR